MRVCLLTRTYPPDSAEGIPRQRQVLAEELARRGHEVYVVTGGPHPGSRLERGVHVHVVRAGPANPYTPRHPTVDALLTESQALFEQAAALHARVPFDVADTPIWSAPGFAALERWSVPVVVWLQTTSAQIAAINGAPPTDEQRAIIGLERRCMARAAGVLADSAAAMEAVCRDYPPPPAVPRGIAYLGLPAAAPATERGASSDGAVEALVVGRLERRKGTPLLFDILPDALRRHPALRVRFVGGDNSGSDGWRARHGVGYADFFRQRHPELCERVRFEGYVSEERLADAYKAARLLLVPTLYESFGFVYLEAMRVGLPVVTFAAGAAPEIFPRGEGSGALLVPPGDDRAFGGAVDAWLGDPARCARAGAAGAARFTEAFRAEHMAEATLAFYEQAARRVPPRPRRSRVVYQAMEALDTGDAVSNIARSSAAMLRDLGQPAAILSRWVSRDVREPTLPPTRILAQPDCGLIFHYWNYSESTWMLEAVTGPRAIHYHNITPAEFHPPGSEAHRVAVRGYDQLRDIANRCELVIGDSGYNIQELARHLRSPLPAVAIHPVIDSEQVRRSPVDEALLARLRAEPGPHLLFVGRIARNKRQERLMHMFDAYWRLIDRRARLWLVGNDQQDTDYRAQLESLRCALPSGSRMAFAGKVSEAAMHAYFRAADVFVCASEHEGFCVPIAQAMAWDLPVVAFAAAAVPETMGRGGLLVREWCPETVAELVHLVASDAALRERLRGRQRENLARFSAAEARARLAAAVRFMTEGERGPLIRDTTEFAAGGSAPAGRGGPCPT